MTGNKYIVVGNCGRVFGLEVFCGKVGVLSGNDVLPFFTYGHYAES